MRTGTVTDENGTFVINARENDTLNISGVQYEPRQIVVITPIYERGRISFYLIPKIEELDQVTISNITLSGNIERDIKETKLDLYLSATDLGLPENTLPPMTVEQRKLYSATSGAGAIGSLINAISGRTKMLKKHVEVGKLRAAVESKRDQFSDSIYMRELNIPEALIEDFVYYIFEQEEEIKQINLDNSLELLNYMLTKSSLYLNLKKTEHLNDIKQ